MKTKHVIGLLLLCVLASMPIGYAADKLNPKLRTANGNVRVILDMSTGDVETLVNAGCRVRYAARHADKVIANCPAASLLALSENDDVEYVDADEVLHTTDAASRSQINADIASTNFGVDGSGIIVAVIDTGINDSSVPSLSGKVIASSDFTEEGTTDDLNGHGTAVASVIASQDIGTLGVAPGASLLNAKAGDTNGDFVSSDVIEAMDWSISQGARVLSMSLGGFVSSCQASSLANYVNAVTDANNVLVVTGAGNSGPATSTLYTPGCAENALTVGAVDSSNNLADFSSRGPTNDGRQKPDLVAPGVGINTANRDGSYSPRDGTSFSTPHASGVAAMMIELRPDLNWNDVKEILKDTATALPYAGNEAGSGLVDADAALDSASSFVLGPRLVTTIVLGTPDQKKNFDLNYTLTNTGSMNATNARLAIRTSSKKLGIPKGRKNINLKTFEPGESFVQNWKLDGKLEGTYNVTITVTADNTQRTDVITLYVPPKPPRN